MIQKARFLFAGAILEDVDLDNTVYALDSTTIDLCLEVFFLEELICTRSWWDTVDWVNKLVGLHFRRYPDLIKPVTERWMASGNFWLQRVCLIFQLTYKDKTDSDMMFDYVRRLADSKEFFLQKGAGWALRQYAKTNPDAVLEFVLNTRLAPLTRREALKNVART
jgi:3-methyladenine DNA glycosylase AlkD